MSQTTEPQLPAGVIAETPPPATTPAVPVASAEVPATPAAALAAGDPAAAAAATVVPVMAATPPAQAAADPADTAVAPIESTSGEVVDLSPPMAMGTPDQPVVPGRPGDIAPITDPDFATPPMTGDRDVDVGMLRNMIAQLRNYAATFAHVVDGEVLRGLTIIRQL